MVDQRLFHNIMPTMQAQYDLAMDLIVTTGLEHEWNAFKLIHDGGACPICGMAFEKRFGFNFPSETKADLFVYYVPGCDCFHVCERCGRTMIEERLEGITWCRNCQYGPPKERKPRKRAESRQPSGKDLAAGDSKEGE